jgi:hypothetical protein
MDPIILSGSLSFSGPLSDEDDGFGQMNHVKTDPAARAPAVMYRLVAMLASLCWALTALLSDVQKLGGIVPAQAFVGMLPRIELALEASLLDWRVKTMPVAAAPSAPRRTAADVM